MDGPEMPVRQGISLRELRLGAAMLLELGRLDSFALEALCPSGSVELCKDADLGRAIKESLRQGWAEMVVNVNMVHVNPMLALAAGKAL